LKTLPFIGFFKPWEEMIGKIDKKKPKDFIAPFFANSDSMGAYIKEPYNKPDEKNYDKWNEAFKFVLNNNPQVNAPLDDTGFILIDPKRIIANQFNEEIASGQVLEIVSSLNEKKISMAIAYLAERKIWQMIYFKEETLKASHK